MISFASLSLSTAIENETLELFASLTFPGAAASTRFASRLAPLVVDELVVIEELVEPPPPPPPPHPAAAIAAAAASTTPTRSRISTSSPLAATWSS